MQSVSMHVGEKCTNVAVIGPAIQWRYTNGLMECRCGVAKKCTESPLLNWPVQQPPKVTDFGWLGTQLGSDFYWKE